MIIILLLGIALGVVGMIYGPDYLEPYLPGGIGSIGSADGKDVEGKVVAKRPHNDKLQITVSTPEGASLVTFNRRVSEIDLLVNEGDYITLSLKKYEPFLTNPPIVKVRKEAPEFKTKQPEGRMTAPGPTSPAKKDTESSKPQEEKMQSPKPEKKKQSEDDANVKQQETPQSGQPESPEKEKKSEPLKDESSEKQNI